MLRYQSCCIIINVIGEAECGFSNGVCGVQCPDVGELRMSMPDWFSSGRTDANFNSVVSSVLQLI